MQVIRANRFKQNVFILVILLIITVIVFTSQIMSFAISLSSFDQENQIHTNQQTDLVEQPKNDLNSRHH